MNSDWRADAACRGMDTEIFYEPTRAREALAVCETCTVRDACLAEAVANDELGVWGGTTAHGRSRLAGRRISGRVAMRRRCRCCGTRLPDGTRSWFCSDACRRQHDGRRQAAYRGTAGPDQAVAWAGAPVAEQALEPDDPRDRAAHAALSDGRWC